jgi:hypothetical protein
MGEERLSTIISKMADEMYHDKRRIEHLEVCKAEFDNGLSKAINTMRYESDKAEKHRQAGLVKDKEIERLKKTLSNEEDAWKNMYNALKKEVWNHETLEIDMKKVSALQTLKKARELREGWNKGALSVAASLAKASKLNAEMRKLLGLINEYADEYGYGVVGEMRTTYQTWLKEQRRDK